MKEYVIYRTRDPRGRAHWDAVLKAQKAWWRKVRRLEREVGLKAVCLEGFGGGGHVAGFEYDRSADVPPHLKVTKTRMRDFLTPRMSTAEGKALKVRIDEIGRMPDPRDDLPGGLTPNFGMFGMCGLEPHEDGTAVYALFGGEPQWTSKHPSDAFDESMWERIPLSEYHRVREGEAARGVDGMGEPVKAGAR